jgi:hypothetical protein
MQPARTELYAQSNQNVKWEIDFYSLFNVWLSRLLAQVVQPVQRLGSIPLVLL